MYINTQVVKTEKMVSLVHKPVIESTIARPNADTPFQAGSLLLRPKWLPFDDRSAGHVKAIDIPGYHIQYTRIMRSLKLRPAHQHQHISAGVAMSWPDFLNKPSLQRIIQVRQVRPGKSRKGQIREQNRNQ